MFTNKLSKLFLMVLAIAIVLVTVSFAASPKIIQPYPDYALRHPGGLVIPVNSNLDTRGSDYYQRHPELSVPAVLGLGASDYFQRHPELITPAGAAVDMTDYFFRHPELSGASLKNVDLTDYFFRHPNN